MKLKTLTNWAERRAGGTSWGNSFLATSIALICGPIFWVSLTVLFGSRSDAVLYALGLAILLCLAVHEGIRFLFRRWRR